jgi:hypothetical protein
VAETAGNLGGDPASARNAGPRAKMGNPCDFWEMQS